MESPPNTAYKVNWSSIQDLNPKAETMGFIKENVGRYLSGLGWQGGRAASAIPQKHKSPGAPGGSAVECVALAQVMISESWDRVLHSPASPSTYVSASLSVSPELKKKQKQNIIVLEHFFCSHWFPVLSYLLALHNCPEVFFCIRKKVEQHNFKACRFPTFSFSFL